MVLVSLTELLKKENICSHIDIFFGAGGGVATDEKTFSIQCKTIFYVCSSLSLKSSSHFYSYASKKSAIKRKFLRNPRVLV